MRKLITALLLKALFRWHTPIYRVTGGRVLGEIKGAPVLILTSIGRKSGKSRSRPLLYLAEEDTYVVVASNGGSPTYPAWYLNLRMNPIVIIQIGRRKFTVIAEIADPQDRARHWPKVAEMFSGYDTYQGRTGRKIPIVVLKKALARY